MIIVARHNCVKLITVITGVSHLPAFRIRISPRIQTHKFQSKKLPSCASQIQARRYCGLKALELCSQAKLYSKRREEMIEMIVAKTAYTANTSTKNAIRPIRRQLFCSSGVWAFVALKKAIKATSDAAKDKTTRKCPILPGNKCSPINCMAD